MQDLFSQSAALEAIKKRPTVIAASLMDGASSICFDMTEGGIGRFLWGIGFTMTEGGSGYLLCCSEETAKRQNLTHPYHFSTHIPNDPDDEDRFVDHPISVGVDLVWVSCLKRSNPELYAEIEADCRRHRGETPSTEAQKNMDKRMDIAADRLESLGFPYIDCGCSVHADGRILRLGNVETGLIIQPIDPDSKEPTQPHFLCETDAEFEQALELLGAIAS